MKRKKVIGLVAVLLVILASILFIGILTFY